MKKLIAIVLTMICVIGVFAGCNNQQSGKGNLGNLETHPDYVPDKINITIGIPLDMNVADYETNAFSG